MPDAVIDNEVASKLDAIAGPTGFQRALELLYDLRNSACSARWVRALSEQDELHWRDAPVAYLHDNGYFKIPLLRSKVSGATLRLNIWSHRLPNMENVHDHRWDYASIVLTGSLIEHQYCIHEDGHLHHRYEYVPRGERSYYVLEARGQTPLAILQQELIGADRLYVRPYALLHAVHTDPGQSTATLQVTFNPIPAARSSVYSTQPVVNSPLKMPATSLSAQQRRMALASLASDLKMD